MTLLIHKLNEKNIKHDVNDVSRTELFGKKSGEMVHVAYVSRDTIPCRMYQLVFTGDRILDIDLINSSLSEKNLLVHRIVKSSRSNIQMPLKEQGVSDFITVFDESIVNKELIHVAMNSQTNGFWIEPRMLISAFENAIVASISEKADDSWLILDTDGEGFKKEMNNVKELLSKEVSIRNLPVLFSSTRKEIESINKDDVDSYEEIIRSDPFIYGHFLVEYFNNKGSKKVPKIKDIIKEIGIDKINIMLIDMLKHDGSIPPESINFSLGESIYKNIQIIISMITQVIDATGYKLGLDPQSGIIIARIIGYNTAKWLSIGGAVKDLDLSTQVELNKHRSIPDIQKKFRGFTQLSLAKYIMQEANFPDEIALAIANHWNPFYQGKHHLLANLLYIIRAKIEEAELLEIKTFSSVSRLHEMLTNNLGISEEINSAFENIQSNLNVTNRMSWRFRLK